MPWTVRPARATDHAAVRRLWDRSPDVHARLFIGSGAFARYLDRNPACSQVAVARGVIIGAVMAGHDGVRGSLHHLAVDSAWRRRGIARRLVAEALRTLAEQGIAATTVWIYERNTAGNAFWASMGYEAWDGCPTWSRHGPPP